jgi:hypothetical protein
MQAVTDTTASLFLRVLAPEEGSMSPEVARYVLTLDFSDQDHERYAVLSAKAQEGTLTEAEGRELDGFINVDGCLALLRLRAQDILGQ